jgi:nickel-type superoxide dismutase maturation protease
MTRVVVEDWSMSPTLWPGDRLLVATWLGPRVGDVVLARDPEAPTRLLVKRVAAARGGAYDLRGDSTADSRDSRAFGPLPRRLIVGRVVWRYAPPGRRGRVA